MIGKITGTLIHKDNQKALIETKLGLALYVFLPKNVLSKIEINNQISIFTYLQVKENELILYGFENLKSYNIFLLLISVNSVGPKTAFNITSHFSAEKILQAIKDNNVDILTLIPGLGKKTALKIILELSQKLKNDFSLDKINLSNDDKLVLEGLSSLGFKTKEIKPILSKIDKNLSLEDKIKKALQLISK